MKKNSYHKLTATEKLLIREQISRGVMRKYIAEDIGISCGALRRAIARHGLGAPAKGISRHGKDRITVHLRLGTVAMLEKECQEFGVQKSVLVRRIIEEHLGMVQGKREGGGEKANAQGRALGSGTGLGPSYPGN